MDVINAVKDNVGALSVGALWMLYVLGDRVWRDQAERKKSASNDAASSDLVGQLNGSLKDAIALGRNERERADGFSTKLSDLSIKIGMLEAELTYTRRSLAEVEAENAKNETVIDKLEIEVRNKDNSIAELVQLNRKLLRSIGCQTPVVPNDAERASVRLTAAA